MAISEEELQAVREQLRLALEKKGEGYVYTEPLVPFFNEETGETELMRADECQYTEPDGDGGLRASCLWGHVLVGLGFEIDALSKMEGAGIADLGVPWNDEVISAAAKCSQQVQDRGWSWGAAVEVFEAVIRDEGETRGVDL